MKKIFAITLALVFALSVPFTSMAAPAVNVEVLGESVVWTDAEPFIDSNNRTLVPLRAVGEALGLTVEWDDKAREAVFSYEEEPDEGSVLSSELHFPIGSNEAYYESNYYGSDGYVYKDGDVIVMDTAAVIVNNRTYAPVRYLAEFFGYEVSWNENTKTVVIGEPTSAEDFNFVDWDVDYATDDEMVFVMTPGTDFNMVKNITVEAVYVNDAEADFYRIDDLENIPAGATTDNYFGICVKGDFRNIDDLGVVFDIVLNTNDYRTYEYSYLMTAFTEL